MKNKPFLYVILLLLLGLNPMFLPAQQPFLFSKQLYVLPMVFDQRFPVDISIALPADTFLKPDILDAAFHYQPSIFSEREKYIADLHRKAYRHFFQNNMRYVHYSKSDFSNGATEMTKIKPSGFLNALFEVEPEINNSIHDITRYRPERRYWFQNGSSLLQFSQNYLSDNWFNGGVGNLNLVSVQSLTLNYKKDKFQFNNFIEWKLSFYTTPNDTLRNFRIGDDLIRTYSDIGLKAFGDKFSYSSNLEIKTKLFKTYKENTTDYTSAFLSPLQINLGILGMKYQLTKKWENDKYRKLNLVVDVSPLSAQYTWVSDKEVKKINRYGIPADKNYLLDLGSTINAKFVYNLNRQTAFSSRLKYFTNYEKNIVESENEILFSINRYFSTRIYIYARYDDTKGITHDPRFGLFQLNEVLSFGFNYKW